MIEKSIQKIRPWFAIDEDVIDGIDWENFESDCKSILNVERDIDDLLKKLYNLVADLGFFDKIKIKLNTDDKYSNRKGILFQIQNYIDREDSIEIKGINVKIKNSQFEEQFNPNGKEENEKYANILYLTNVIARVLQTSSEQIKGKLKDADSLIKMFYNLKTQVMENLLRNRKSGKTNGMLISFVNDESLEGTSRYFLISLPGYLEPFRVQFDYKTQEIIEDKFDIDKMDNIPFFSMNENDTGQYLRSVFPLKLSPELEETIYAMYFQSKNGNKNISPWLQERIKYYCEYLPEVTTTVGRKLAELRVALNNLKQELKKLQKDTRRARAQVKRESLNNAIAEKQKEIFAVNDEIDSIEHEKKIPERGKE